MLTRLRSGLLTQFVQTLHLREDAPMPSEVKAAHDRIFQIRRSFSPAAGAKILRFKKQ